MSQQEPSKFSNDNDSKTIENVPLSLHNINNLLSSSELNNTHNDNYILNNNFLQITSISNNNKPENNDRNTISSNYSNILNNVDISINSFILLLYKELFSSNNLLNLENYLKNGYKKLSTLLNNEKNNQNIFRDILKIFNETIKKVIEIKLKEVSIYINQFKSKLLFMEQSNKYLIKQNFLKQTKIDILENEIDSYIEMEEEFDEMKEKFKYENGKFLHNEKKENEILILRAENSNLKKIIDRNEKTIEEKELIIENIKKKSSSMFNTNNNTLKNSFELNDTDNPTTLMLLRQNQNQIFSQNNSNMASNKSFNTIKYKSPRNDITYRTNKNYQRSNNKKLSYIENNDYQNSKKSILVNKMSNKDLITKRIKNKVLNMKKIRRINDNCLEHYNKSSAHITNSIISNNSNSNSNKRIKKNLNSYFKNTKNNIINAVGRIHKKLNSGLTNANLSNIIKNNSNKIIVNSILDNNMNNTNLYNNNSFLSKTTRKKFLGSKKSTKTNLKQSKNDYILIRNNNSLMKCPNTFNNNNFENSLAMKNSNIIINNIIQNAGSVPISGPNSKSKDKSNIVDNINSKQYKKDKNMKQKSSGLLSSNNKKN